MGAQATRTESLSGLWSGRYWYMSTELHIPATVPFSAVILDTDGKITGTTLEPNSFVNNELIELTSIIDGQREGGMIDFLKIYDDLPDLHQYPIDYAGEVDEDLSRIVGGWSITHDLDEVRGGFELVRLSQTVEMSRSISNEL
ncbi:MAG: hypothetical protein CME88_08910 [Hirschia sp.]|mgnify:FL=1|nr:hypothetical protein [Hirschia sp.]MBF18483.1 hypothetical protein [Hirschia sp.]